MAREFPYFRWFPKDAEADEKYGLMDDAELGFFHRCLNKAWVNEGLPNDPEERARLLRTPRPIADERWRRVGKCFIPSELFPGKLVNPRQEEERKHAVMKSRIAMESAKSRYKPASAPASAHTSAPKQQPFTQEQADEVCFAFDRHLKHANREPRDTVLQVVLSMNGDFDWKKFRARHSKYCEHYAEHGWRYCTLTFLGWIRAGMPPAPPPEKKHDGKQEVKHGQYRELPRYEKPRD